MAAGAVRFSSGDHEPEEVAWASRKILDASRAGSIVVDVYGEGVYPSVEKKHEY